MEIKKLLLITVMVVVVSIGLFGSIWTYNIANGKFTIQFEMDQDTRDYLVEHDYCIFGISESYSSDKPSYNFLGDCEYLDKSLIRIKELEKERIEKEAEKEITVAVGSEPVRLIKG